MIRSSSGGTALLSLLAFQNAGQLLNYVDFSLRTIYNSSTLLRGVAPLGVRYDVTDGTAVYVYYQFNKGLSSGNPIIN